MVCDGVHKLGYVYETLHSPSPIKSSIKMCTDAQHITRKPVATGSINIILNTSRLGRFDTASGGNIKTLPVIDQTDSRNLAYSQYFTGDRQI